MPTIYNRRRYNYDGLAPGAPAPAAPPPPVTAGPEPQPTPTPPPAAPAPVVPPAGPGTTQQNWLDYLSQGYTPGSNLFGIDAYRRDRANEFFRTRGGHQLYDWFRQIYDRNPLAGRAFWQQIVGSGSGQNDLAAATIHKMFGGDMNAYNAWRNELHHAGRENYLGNFNLVTGTWDNGMGPEAALYNGAQNSWNWNSMNQGAWNPYTYQTGLQSLPGINPATGLPYSQAGSESWQTYGAGQYFDPTQGAAYAPPALQAAFAAGQVPGYNQQGQLISALTQPQAAAGTTTSAASTPRIPVPKVPVPDAKTPVAPTTVNTAAGGPSTVNPYASAAGSTYKYTQR